LLINHESYRSLTSAVFGVSFFCYEFLVAASIGTGNAVL